MTACGNQTTRLTNGKIGHRKSSSVLSMRFPVVNWHSRSVAISAWYIAVMTLIESEESDLSSRYKTQGTTASYSTGHCATVNNQHSKCLIALITIQKIEIYLKGKLLFSVIYNKAVTCTCDQWPVTYVQPANAYFEQVQHTMWVFTPKYCYSIFQ